MTGRLSPRVVRMLREIYAPPLDPGYWDQLQRRIVARVATERVGTRGLGDPWGAAFGAWARAGVIAAGLAVVCAGLATWRSQVAEARATQRAYETMLATPTPSGGGPVWLVDATGVSDGSAP